MANEFSGEIVITNAQSHNILHLGGIPGTQKGPGGKVTHTQHPGIVLSNDAGDARMSIMADLATLILGGLGANGKVSLRNHSGIATIEFESEDTNNDGSIHLSQPGGTTSSHLTPSQIDLTVNGHSRVFLDSADSNIYLGGNGMGGEIFLYPAGGNFKGGTPTKPSLHLSGDAGDINCGNADCAEEFDIDETEEISPGDVMIIDENDRLRKCISAYDKRVAGVLSGAGEYKPAIVLDRKIGPHRRVPVALVGKTYCQVDAQYAPVELGDLLTTSPTVGFAMKATEPLRAFGAVIGKALRPLRAGRGLVPILVALQ